MNLNTFISGFFTADSCDRPFKHHRPLFNIGPGLNRMAKPIKPFFKSMFGKLCVYSIADLAGFYLGAAAFEYPTKDVGCRMGKSLLPALVKATALASCPVSILILAKKTSHSTLHVFPVVASSALLTWATVMSLDDLGCQGGGTILGSLGSMTGSILCGYAALRMVGSKVVLWDKEDPWGAYSIRMIRYLVVGGIGNGFTKLPNPFFRILSKGGVEVLKQVAYNSEVVFPTVKQFIKEGGLPSRVVVSKISLMINNRFFGKKQTQMAREMSEWLTPVLLARLPSFVQMTLKTGISLGAGWSIESLSSRSNLMALVIARAFYKFASLIKNSKEIQNAHIDFQKAFFNPLQGENVEEFTEACIEEKKKRLIDALQGAIENENPIAHRVVNVVLRRIMNDSSLAAAVGDLIQQIRTKEVELIGYELLKPRYADYLREIIQIYIYLYIVYTLTKFREISQEAASREELSELTSEEENAIILDLI